MAIMVYYTSNNSRTDKTRKITDELGNTVEIKMWRISQPGKRNQHTFKYSLVYIVNSKRVIGYDNAERKGDHRHYGNKEESYEFISLKKLTEDFYNDIEAYRKVILCRPKRFK